MTAPLHERLAEAAKKVNSPGEWKCQIITYTNERTGLSFEVGSVSGPEGLLELELTPADAQYIESAQPANVAKLCEQVRVMKEALDDLFGADMVYCMMGDGKQDQIDAIAKARAARAMVDEK